MRTVWIVDLTFNVDDSFVDVRRFASVIALSVGTRRIMSAQDASNSSEPKTTAASKSWMQRLPRFVLLTLIPLIMAWGVFVVLSNPRYRPVVISVYEAGILKADPETLNMGQVKTDAQAQRAFFLTNVGGRPIVIDRVETSCGCTLAKLEKKEVSPGEVISLEVKLDTSLKLGPVRKRVTVFSNDSKRPELDLFLVGTVLPQMKGHEKIAVKDPLVLFKGQCATCHVMKGKGKSGKALFQADCGMCHGLNGQGGVAPSLLSQDYEDPAVLTATREVIANGAAENPEMPPYSQARGGPLNDGEIDSLVRFLAFQSSLAKRGQLDEHGFPKELPEVD